MEQQQTGSKAYLFSIVMVAVLGGLLFGYDTAVISGAEKGLQAFFKGAGDFEYTDVMHGFTSSSALIGCIIGSSLSGLFASRLGRKRSLIFAGVCFFLSAWGSMEPGILSPASGTCRLDVAGGIQLLSCAGWYRCRYGFSHLSDVYRRNRSEQYARYAGELQSVCHHLRSAGGLLRQFHHHGFPPILSTMLRVPSPIWWMRSGPSRRVGDICLVARWFRQDCSPS